jgi:hypothetical protein
VEPLNEVRVSDLSRGSNALLVGAEAHRSTAPMRS